MSDSKRHNEIDYDTSIRELIKKIDKEKGFFGLWDNLRVLLSFILISALIFFSVFAVTHIGSVSTTDGLVVAFAGLAVILALGQLQIEDLNEKVILTAYVRAKEKFKITEDEKPFLKALLKMKSQNSEFNLAQIYKICPENFAKREVIRKTL